MPEVAEQIKMLRRVLVILALTFGKPITAQTLADAIVKARELDQLLLP